MQIVETDVMKGTSWICGTKRGSTVSHDICDNVARTMIARVPLCTSFDVGGTLVPTLTCYRLANFKAISVYTVVCSPKNVID